jgi:hypothetical protein
VDRVLFDPGIQDPDPGWEKIQIQDPESGMNIPDLIIKNLVRTVTENAGSRILDNYSGSATLPLSFQNFIEN